jgi:UDP-glucose 4-epimerase
MVNNLQAMSGVYAVMKKRVLLTGGAGYIGSHTYLALIKAGYDVVIIDNFANSQEDVIDRLALLTGNPVTMRRVDVLDRHALNDVFAEFRFDAVVHFAARKAVSESVLKPLSYFETNCTGLVNLLQTMQRAGVFKLVFSSSATVYGDPRVAPIPETEPTSFTNPYGFTKIMGEQILTQTAAADSRWKFGILRYFNPAGAHSSGLIGEDPKNLPENLMPFIAKVASGQLPSLLVFGTDYDTPDGTGVRDYIHVEDLAEGHVLSLRALIDKSEAHLVNLGTGRGYSVMEVLRAYGKACGQELPYILAPRRAGDIATYCADPSLARATLGFEAKRGLDEMCASSWDWIRKTRNSA